MESSPSEGEGEVVEVNERFIRDRLVQLHGADEVAFWPVDA